MKVSELVRAACMNLELQHRSKADVLREMVESMDLDGMVADKAALVDALWEREQLGSTGIGDGIAIPHARTDAVRSIIILFGRSESGVEFAAMDAKPVHLFFMIASPPSAAGEYLKVLAHLAGMLKQKEFRDELLRAECCEDVVRLISKRDDEAERKR